MCPVGGFWKCNWTNYILLTTSYFILLYFIYTVHNCKEAPGIKYGSIHFDSPSKEGKQHYKLSCEKGYKEDHTNPKHEMVCSNSMQWENTPSCKRMYWDIITSCVNIPSVCVLMFGGQEDRSKVKGIPLKNVIFGTLAWVICITNEIKFLCACFCRILRIVG